MAHLEKIIAAGYSTMLLSAEFLGGKNRVFDYNNVITCRDGYLFSAVAGPGTYCIPRPSSLPNYPPSKLVGESVPFDYPGPYTALEIGFPSDRPEPWEPIDGDLFWKQYAEDEDAPINTVYPFVPVELVRALVRLHGGEEDLPLEQSGWSSTNGPGRNWGNQVAALEEEARRLLRTNLED